MGAGPESGPGSLVGLGGRLLSAPNRKTDRTRPTIAVQTLTLPRGVTEAQMVDRLFRLDANYRDNLPYDLSPQAAEPGYNSNSYVAGLLATAEIGKASFRERVCPYV